MPSIYTILFSVLPTRHPIFLSRNFLFSSYSSSVAERILGHLLKNKCNVEKVLSSVKAGLDYPCIIQVLSIGSTNEPQLALRFFVWAAVQNTYRHSSYMYSLASKLLKIEQNPQIVADVVDAYRAEDCIVSVKMFKVILNLCKASKDAKLGLWVLRKMMEFNCRPDTVSYNMVIRLYVEKGELDEATGLMREMNLIDLYPDMITYALIMKGLCDVGRLENAFGLIEVMKGHGCVPNAVIYSMLLDGICMHANLETAMEFLEKMEKENGELKPNLVSYTTIIKGYVAKGKTMDAVNILEQMTSLGVKPNKVTMISIFDGLCKDDCVDEARRVIYKVYEDGIGKNRRSGLTCDELHSLLITSLFRAGKCKEAENTLRMMIAHGMMPNGSVLSCLIEWMLSEGRVRDAFFLFDTLEKAGKCPPLDSKIYSILLVGLCQENSFLEVVKLAKVTMDRRVLLKSPHREIIIRFLINCSEIGLASSIANSNR